MRVVWGTDLHLNFLDPPDVERFTAAIAERGPDAVLLAGDIGEAGSVEGYLGQIAERLARPVYFVLGNHDFYGGSIGAVRRRIVELCDGSRWLRWLGCEEAVELTPEVGLVGHDGWGDGRFGAGMASTVMLNDFVRIEELSWLRPEERFARLAALGDEAAAHLERSLSTALERYPRVLVLTHVPPFREACWHEGRISGDDWLPHFSCKATGDVLRRLMRSRADRELTVLCGHTHGAGFVEILPNLKVHTGGAQYGRPELQPTIEI